MLSTFTLSCWARKNGSLSGKLAVTRIGGWNLCGLLFTCVALKTGCEKWYPDGRILDTGRYSDVQECWVEQDHSVSTTPAGHRLEQLITFKLFDCGCWGCLVAMESHNSGQWEEVNDVARTRSWFALFIFC